MNSICQKQEFCGVNSDCTNRVAHCNIFKNLKVLRSCFYSLCLKSQLSGFMYTFIKFYTRIKHGYKDQRNGIYSGSRLAVWSLKSVQNEEN
jgi:hypothetical protein